MKIVFAVFLVVHGLIHLIGTAKAFDVADIPQLTQAIARPLGILWLLAAALFLSAAISQPATRGPHRRLPPTTVEAT
jgi:hypothetical protein